MCWSFKEYFYLIFIEEKCIYFFIFLFIYLYGNGPQLSATSRCLSGLWKEIYIDKFCLEMLDFLQIKSWTFYRWIYIYMYILANQSNRACREFQQLLWKLYKLKTFESCLVFCSCVIFGFYFFSFYLDQLK